MAPAILLSPIWRVVTGVLVVAAWLTLPTYVLSLVLLPPVPPIVMIRSFVVGTALPLAVAWGIVRAFTGSIALRDGVLALRRGDLEVDVPGGAIAAGRPWWVPLPRPGLGIRLRHGGAVPVGIVPRRMAETLGLFETAGICTSGIRRHPNVVYALARPPRRWWEPVLKFAGFGLLPASVLFYTHQHIAYGGTFGQYYLESSRAYFTTFALYWGTTAILLVSYASFWRAGAEVVAWLAGAMAPRSAPTARRIADAICAVAYYGGVPVLLYLRYFGE